MKVLGVIPARYQSSRFPGKPLVDIDGKSMIRRVWEQASKSKILSQVIIATDDQRIFDHAESLGAQVLLTSGSHLNGTERCGEVVSQLNQSYDFVINIQGDEPFITPNQIDLLASSLEPKTELATLIKHEDSYESFSDQNTIKVVGNERNEALYFSRSPIPFFKITGDFKGFMKHIGIYAYRVDVLNKITQMTATPLEGAESLEQLRWLENGHTIDLVETDEESHSVDTPEDLERILALHVED